MSDKLQFVAGSARRLHRERGAKQSRSSSNPTTFSLSRAPQGAFIGNAGPSRAAAPRTRQLSVCRGLRKAPSSGTRGQAEPCLLERDKLKFVGHLRSKRSESHRTAFLRLNHLYNPLA